ncbi:flowering locus K homology domain [Selaginella moellendorffii]|uniref:flowering locus K homology domain n=1 Tax=Selaginella moellendorffii TaxID=88036 RepID=UPI000D1C4809|nr:flowering locus K homology domain [Selaginella moellendorffii]|eukprot:XP_024519491.1 flowering locus K homology domain [Selaginella moellendorffii]
MACSVIIGEPVDLLHLEDPASVTLPSTVAGSQEETPPGERKWPGWPGDNVFRLIVPLHKVGAIIGRKGEFVKRMCEETRSRIKILDGVPGTLERIVLVSAKEDPEATISPAMDGLLRVHRRVTEGSSGDGEPVEHIILPSGLVQSRLLVTATQAGSLIGRQGATIRSIQETSGATVRIMPELPLCALADDRMVEVQGEILKVQKAMELVVSHLRKFLVDRSVLQLFEFNRAMSSQVQGQQAAAIATSWATPTVAATTPYSSTDYYADQAQSQHYAVSMYGGDPGRVDVTSTTPAPPAESVSQQLQVPLLYADAIIGTAGANINYMRRTSGATISIQETPNAPGEMTIEVHGQSTQVQTAQQLLQNFMAGAAGTTAATTCTTSDYSYTTQNTLYASGMSYSPSAYGSQYSSGYVYYGS